MLSGPGRGKPSKCSSGRSRGNLELTVTQLVAAATPGAGSAAALWKGPGRSLRHMHLVLNIEVWLLRRPRRSRPGQGANSGAAAKIQSEHLPVVPSVGF